MGNKPVEEFKDIKTLKDKPNGYFRHGRKVRVYRDENFVKRIQKKKYGWDEAMVECLNHVVEVKGVDLDQGIKIMSPEKNVWTFDRNALEAISEDDGIKIENNKEIPIQLKEEEPLNSIDERKMSSIKKPVKNLPSKESGYLNQKYKKGDTVHLSSDEKKFIKLQPEVGHYSRQTMGGMLGAHVLVKIVSAHCVEVLWKGDIFSIHPDLIVEESVTEELPEDLKHEYVYPPELNKMLTAIIEGKLEEVYFLLNMDLLNSKGYTGITLINFSCCCGQLEIFKAFLDVGASMDICDVNGLFPIHNCVVNNHNHILKYILLNDRGAVLKLSMDGKSALHFAVIGKNMNAIKMLIEADINIFLMDDDGKVASQYTTDRETLNLIELSVKVPIVMDSQASLDLSRKNECDICKDQVKDVFFIPCGHASCSECSKQINICHICKTRIENTNVLNL